MLSGDSEMAVIQQTLPPLINGVSQQPDSLMAPGTVRRCDNFLPDPVWGLAKRPGSELVSTTSITEKGSWFNVTLSESEDFLLFVGRSGNVKIWDAASGIEQTVSTQVTSYASHGKQGDIEVLQIGDFVFLLNRTKRVNKSSATLPAQRVHAWVSVEAVSYNTEYRVSLKDSVLNLTFSYTTPSTGSLDVQTVITGIRSAFTSALAAASSTRWTSLAAGNNIIFIQSGGAWPSTQDPLIIDARGGFTGTAIRGYSGSVASVADLPSQYLVGAHVKVNPSSDVGQGYWVAFESRDQNPTDTIGTGVWVESAKPGEQFRVDYTTMPHALVRRADGTWIMRSLDAVSPLAASQSVGGVVTAVAPTGTYRGRYGIGQTIPLYGGSGKGLKITVTNTNSSGAPTAAEVVTGGQGYTAASTVTALNGDAFTISTVATQTLFNPVFANEKWTGRSVGELSTIPWPTFVDSYITGIGFYLNRLVLMSEDTVITSKAGDYYNFWPTSAIQVLDDDPVDLNAGASSRLTFRYAIPYNRQLVLVSEDAQYALRTRDEAFSPRSAELTSISKIRTSTAIRPIRNQLSWFVTEEAPGGVRFYEMFPGADEDPNLGRPEVLNLQAPTYIPPFVFTADADADAGILACVSEQEQNTVYLWRWAEAGRQRIQAAWFRYILESTIRHIYMLDDYMYVVGDFNGVTAISRFRLSVTDPRGFIEFDGKTFNPRLDLQLYPVNPTFNVITGITSVDLNGTVYDDFPGELTVFIVDGPKTGVFLNGSITSGILQIEEDTKTGNIIIGLPFVASAVLPHMYVRGDRSEVVFPPKVRRLIVRAYTSGAFEVKVQSPGRPDFTRRCDLKTPTNYLLGDVAMYRVAQASAPIMADGDKAEVTLIAPDSLPTNIQEVSWQGTYSTRGITPR
jgi:hypothetical protein